jgi:microcompartment protein CcmL/EutN
MNTDILDQAPETPALGFIELSSISRGLYLTDVVAKKAPIKIVASQPISSGKFVLFFTGDVASVDESYRAALLLGEGLILNQIVILGVHEKLAPFLSALWGTQMGHFYLESKFSETAIGIVESNTMAGAVLAADFALKAANVELYRMRLGQGIGGKAYFILMGLQEEVEAALESAQICLINLNCLCRVDLVPRPEPEALVYF